MCGAVSYDMECYAWAMQRKEKEMGKALVGIVMGSDSDMPVMAEAAKILDQFGISYEMDVISAHREPDEFAR